MVRAYKWIVSTNPSPPPPPSPALLCAGMIILKFVDAKGKKKERRTEIGRPKYLIQGRQLNLLGQKGVEIGRDCGLAEGCTKF